MRRLIRVERRHADQGEHVNRRQRLAGGRCDVPQACRGIAGRRADDRRRRAIQSAGVLRRMLTSRVRRRHSRASMSCCIPPTGATTPLHARGEGHSGVPNRSDALRQAGSPAYLPWRAGPTSHRVARDPSTRAPHCSTVSSGRGRPRAPHGRRRKPCDEGNRLPCAQRPPPGSLAVDVTSAAERPGEGKHPEPEIAAHGVDASRVPHRDCRGFDGTVWRLERRDQAAEPIGLLDDLHGDSCERQIVRRRKPGETSPDHRDGLHRAFDRTVTTTRDGDTPAMIGKVSSGQAGSRRPGTGTRRL